MIQTDAAGLSLCPNCQTPIPRGHGVKQCTRCHRFVSDVPSPPRRPRKTDIDQENDLLVEEYRPRTASLKASCFQLARAHVEARTLPIGSPEWQRVMTVAADLAQVLEASRPTPEVAAIMNLEQSSPDEVVERAEAVLRAAWQVRDAKRYADQVAARASAEHRAAAGLPPAAEDSTDAAPPTASAPPEHCPYCQRLQSDCEQLREERPEIWEVICSRNPTAIEQKADRKTREMFESLRRFGPARY